MSIDTLAELRATCHYSEDGGTDAEGYDLGSVDSLVGYKDALEDAYASIAVKAAAWDALDTALRANARGELSSGDVCAIGFDQQERLSAR